MAVGLHPPAGYRVDDLRAIGLVERRTFGPRDLRDRFAKTVLGEGMPDIDAHGAKSRDIEMRVERRLARIRRELIENRQAPEMRHGANPADGLLAVAHFRADKGDPMDWHSRLRKASIVSRLWLIVPRLVDATMITGRAQWANRSANSSSGLTGTSAPPAPSMISGPSTGGMSRSFQRDGDTFLRRRKMRRGGRFSR